MEAFTLYLVKSVIWLTSFTIIYFIFLKNERYFRLKRYFLIAGILISFIFPLFSFHYQVDLPASPAIDITGLTPSDAGTIPVDQPASNDKAFDFRYILLLAYLSGILFFVFRAMRHIGLLLNTINKTKVNNLNQARLIRASEFSGSFSFFNYVFINPSIDEKELDVIMNHELVHVTQKHWLDLLLVEILRLVQWVNPFAWIYTGFIRQNHEYIADEVTLQRTSDPAIYKAVLINQLFDSRVFSLSNSFNYSLNKKRFDMMKKIVTSPYRKLKILLVLPVFAIVFYAFATPEYHYAESSDNAMNIDKAAASLTTENTDPQEQSKVRIRNSDGSQANPLIVIDGKISTKNVEEIDPSTIASMTVLKDNSAAEKYGEKGKVGVIEITTIKTFALAPDINQKTVKGIVLKEDGQPLEGVGINSTGTAGNAYLSATGKDGRFEIKNVQPDASLLFFCRGYIVQTLKADFNKEMSVTMKKDPEYNAPPIQRPSPIVVIDGVISEKNYSDAVKELGYNMGINKMIMGKEAIDKYGDKGANGVMEITTRKKALEMGLKPPFPRLAPEDFPTFQGQIGSHFNEWVTNQVRYPSEAQTKKLEGWITINFTIELNGSISNVVSVGPVDPILSEEVIRVIKSSPNWEPPKNRAVDMPFTSSVQVGFRLPDRIIKEAPFVVVEQMPQYPGNEGAILDFIKTNTRYPEELKAEKIEGRVIVRFIVNTEGNTEGISIQKGVHPLLDAEAVRVVKMLSGFKPGMQEGKAVNVWFMVPVNFIPPN